MATIPPTEPKQMHLQDLIARCLQETEHFFHKRAHEDHYCFELFRRAIEGNEALAWDGIYTGYKGLVAGWVLDHPNFRSTGEEVQYFVNRAFESMAKYLKKPSVFAKFSSLESLLAYLKKCARSSVRDVWRKHEQAPVELPVDLVASADVDLIQHVVQIEQRVKLWQRVATRLQNEKERLVVEGYFVFGLKPRQIYALHSAVFGDVLEIHRIKQNLLERLNRDPELQELWREHT